MASKQSVTYVSDLSGEDITDNDAPTMKFGWDGADYTIDLTAKEAEKFYKAVAPYLDAATKVSGASSNGKARRTPKRTNLGPSAQELRDWGRQNGLEVPERGRIPASIREAFESAQTQPGAPAAQE